MDDIDREILILLKQDGRMSATDIGARIGRSRAVVSARMQAMVDEGSISGFTVLTPPPPISVLFEIRFSRHGLCESMVQHFRARYSLEHAWSVTGESDLFIKAGAATTVEIHEMRNHLAAHGHTTRIVTHTVMKTWQASPHVPPTMKA